MSGAARPGEEAGRARGAERIWLLAAWLAVAWFHLWTVRSTGEPLWPGPERGDHFNLLVDGWLDGQLHLKTPVPEELLRLADPYDPAQRRPGLGLHDASLYQGKYYLYFGALPAALTLLPFRALTGADLPLATAVLVFVHAGFLAAAALWLALRRRYFPDSAPAVAAAGVLALGLAGLGPLLLRRPAMWELPIAGGYFFAMAALGAAWRSAEAPDAAGRARWLAGTALALGCAVASRPTYLFALPALAVPVVWWAWRERRWPWREVLHAAVPLAAAGAAVAGHNFARFGDPRQFGQAYQLSLDYESKQPHFQLRYVPYNAAQHFLGWARWERYFPFVRPPELRPAPEGYTRHRGDVHGLANMPVYWFVLLAPLAGWRRPSAERGRLAVWLGLAAAATAGTGGIMLLFFSALARYQLEFAPTLALVGAVGLLAVERLAAGWRRGRGAVRVLLVAAGGWSAGYAVLATWQVDGLLKEQDPAGRERLARALNTVPAWWERAAGVRYGPIELAVRVPERSGPWEEALLTAGRGAEPARVFLRGGADGTVRLGYAAGGAPERTSAPLAARPGGRLTVRATLGSLYPPDEHPYFGGMDVRERLGRQRRVRIEADGVKVLEGYHRLVPGGPVWVGREAGFDGTVERVERGVAMAVPPAAAPASGETLRLQVEWPAAAGTPEKAEPLLVTGRTGAGDFLAVEPVRPGTVRFVFDHWGSPGRTSGDVAVAVGRTQTVEVTMPSLRTVENAERVEPERSGALRVAIDGTTVWEVPAKFFTVEPGEVFVGVNPLGGTSCAATFAGRIAAAERVER